MRSEAADMDSLV